MNKQVINITLVMTEMCNLACKYCYVCSTNKTLKISKEVIDASIDLARDFLKDETVDIRFDLFGGEALLAWEECKYFLEEMKTKLYDVFPGRILNATIYTNLTLLTDEHMQYLMAYNDGDLLEGLCHLSYSLDGCKEANDQSRVFKNGKGTYDVVMEKIELLKKYIPADAIKFKSVIAPENVKYLMQTVREFKDLGLFRLSLGPARTNSWTPESVAEYEKQLHELGDFYIEQFGTGVFYDIFSIPVLDFEVNKHQRGFCGAGRSMFAVSPEGDIYPCQRFYNNRSGYILGNVLKNGIEQENKWSKLFKRYTLSNMVGCSKCESFEHYNCPYGSCMATNFEESKNIFIKSDETCKLLAITTKEAMRVHEALKSNDLYLRTLERVHGKR